MGRVTGSQPAHGKQQSTRVQVAVLPSVPVTTARWHVVCRKPVGRGSGSEAAWGLETLRPLSSSGVDSHAALMPCGCSSATATDTFLMDPSGSPRDPGAFS